MKKALIELVGTFFLSLAIVLSKDPITIGVVLAVLIYVGLKYEAGHFNGAVSLAALLSKKIDFKTFGLFLIAQILGATLAFLFAALMIDISPLPKPVFLGGFLAEFLFTLLLALTAISIDPKTNQNAPLIIGLALFVGISSTVEISGGLLNPSIAIAQLINSLIKGSIGFSGIFIYIFAPFLAGAAFFINKFIQTKSQVLEQKLNIKSEQNSQTPQQPPKPQQQFQPQSIIEPNKMAQTPIQKVSPQDQKEVNVVAQTVITTTQS